MSTIYIATVGTSALGNRPLPGHHRAALIAADPARFEPGPRLKNLGHPAHADDTRRWIDASVLDHISLLGAFNSAADRAALGSTTAELSSLALIHAERHALGRIVLLASDTPSGRVAAEIVQSAGQAVWRDSAIFETRVCEGLDPERPDDFVNVGLANLRSIARQVDKENPGAEVVINITGGLKGGIPFLTVLAIELRRDLVYLFEHSAALTWISGQRLREHLAKEHPEVRPADVARNWFL